MTPDLPDLTPVVSEQPGRGESRAQAIIDNVMVGVAEVTLDGRMTAVNPMLCRTLGYSPSELMGKKVLDITHPDDVERTVSHLVRVLSGEQTSATLEKRYLRSDGEVIWARSSMSAVRDERGEVEALVAVMTDITALKRAEEELRDSRERLSFALDVAGLGEWEQDLHDGSVKRSPGHDAIFGYPQGHPSWNQETFREHVVPEDRAFVDEELRQAQDREEPWDFQCRVVRADGARRWIWARGQTRRDAHGRPSHLVGLVQDVTVAREAELALQETRALLEVRVRERTRELQTANEELEAFTYSVSHDLRAPVRHIIGFSGLLRRALGDTADARVGQYLRVVEEAAGRMNVMIDAMLGLSRTSRQSMRVGPVDLGVLVSAVRQELEPDLSGRDVRWEVGPLPCVQGDAETLRGVVTNLLSNALKYSRDREVTRVKVWAEQDPEQWSVHVQDNGVGFDPKYAEKLFGVFQRLHRDSEFEGVGVGLANVRRVVERHGGRVWAESRPGEGATFSFSLPNDA